MNEKEATDALNLVRDLLCRGVDAKDPVYLYKRVLNALHEANEPTNFLEFLNGLVSSRYAWGGIVGGIVYVLLQSYLKSEWFLPTRFSLKARIGFGMVYIIILSPVLAYLFNQSDLLSGAIIGIGGPSILSDPLAKLRQDESDKRARKLVEDTRDK